MRNSRMLRPLAAALVFAAGVATAAPAVIERTVVTETEWIHFDNAPVGSSATGNTHVGRFNGQSASATEMYVGFLSINHYDCSPGDSPLNEVNNCVLLGFSSPSDGDRPFANYVISGNEKQLTIGGQVLMYFYPSDGAAGPPTLTALNLTYNWVGLFDQTVDNYENSEGAREKYVGTLYSASVSGNVGTNVVTGATTVARYGTVTLYDLTK